MQNINYQEKIAEILINISSVKFSFDNPFTLTSGNKSPVYVDCRKIISHVNERNIILQTTAEYIKNNNLKFDIFAGGETAGIPYAAFLADRFQKKMIYVRKKTKGFGKNQQIEGEFNPGQKAILIEDLATDGGSKVVFIEAMRKASIEVSDIFVIFYYDIFDISKTLLSPLNVKIHYLCNWKNIINVIKNKKILSNEDISSLEIFLKDPKKWQFLNE